ncbi:MAG: 50S ribosomal protein L25 [Desulfamplus sp.]|nr:50S ribosomal protein L25 [Desulfamplus sp.]MBF0389694.1 50S ribosomal protein L25 [Desulfamplus sp.]
MELIDLKAEIRQGVGKTASRAIRKSNAIPAILYGPQTEPVLLSLANYDFSEIIRKNGSTGLFLNLEVAGDSKPSRTVLLKDIQTDVFGINYLHADFQEVDINVKVSVMVPVEATGVAPGIKAGGLLQIIRRELELICRPIDVPDSVCVDVSNLEIGDAIHVKDIDLGENIQIPHEVNFTVITLVPPSTSKASSTEVAAGEAAE